MTVRRHDTEVQPADTMPTDDFDALLRASSLGAPHVLAEAEPLPPDARSRLDQAAISTERIVTAPDRMGITAEAATPATTDTEASEFLPSPHYSPTRSAGRPTVPLSRENARPLVVFVNFSPSKKSSETERRNLQELYWKLLHEQLPVHTGDERLGDNPWAVWQAPAEAAPMIELLMCGGLSRDKPLSQIYEAVTRWTAAFELRAHDVTANDATDNLCRWAELAPDNGGGPGRFLTGRHNCAAGRWTPEGFVLRQMHRLLRRHPARLPETALPLTADHWLFSALNGLEPEGTARVPWAHPATDEAAARELGYLTLHLWKTSCGDRTGRVPGTSGSGMPTCPHSTAASLASPGTRLPWLLPGDCYDGTAGEIRDAMERVSTFLLKDHQRQASQLPPATAGPPRHGVGSYVPAPLDLVPVWRALAACWATRHTTMPLRLHTDEYDPGRLLPARFTYRTLDPYAIEIAFRPQSPDAKRWVFARDLLLNGLDRSTGEGNVIVRPRPGPTPDSRDTFIHLKSPQGTALLSAPRTDLESYLKQTQQAVPSGAEHQHVSDTLDNLERELAALTSSGAAS